MMRIPPAEILFESTRDDAPDPSLVTVAVSLYNYAQFVPQCLASIAAQRHKALELIVVDDASAVDDSAAVARDWMEAQHERFTRVCLIRHRRNQGLAEARNTAFSQARASHVFVIDADNEIYPRAIGRLQQAANDSGAAATYSQLEVYGNRRGIGLADVWQPNRLRHGNYIDAMALVSRQAWSDVGGYTHLEGGWEDYDFWCKFIEHGYEALFVPEILCRYRVHSTSMLRTETSTSYEALFSQMTFRHPWLRLAPITEEWKG
ncbi:glycosyltransferase family 2 protein [Falsiroseomonas sp. E2-1-a20]|uniref:glycosyltransferase family 2 protein n=1 Tax=Falsiroseomonas sp. E2-1-a20 TaxID=3239300 RepID=UPI003F3429BA